ncbi:hypothetical protein [Paraburkholderia phosphatilytica]|uniref:hypothetical protein n=1 Tax=Paraburkholderia phosphatilytica TaxID=2282883 RepID=UPI0013E0B3CF|nr:hypothetical protein [Paraburkholderia phosphatilytica]
MTTTTKETTAVSTHVQAFSAIEEAVAAFEKRHKGVVHDCTTTAGDKAARKDRQEVQEHISSIELKRVELKEPHLTAGREIDALAKVYTARLATLKAGYDTQIKAEENRKAEAKRAAEREAQLKRDEEAAAARKEAEEKAAALEAENVVLRAKLAAAQPAQEPVQDEPPHIVERAYTYAPTGWDRIEAGDEYEGGPADVIRAERGSPETDPALRERVGHTIDHALLDLLDAGHAHGATEERNTKPVTRFRLPGAGEITDALSDHAKKRTNVRHVCDVLEAIRKITGLQ